MYGLTLVCVHCVSNSWCMVWPWYVSIVHLTADEWSIYGMSALFPRLLMCDLSMICLNCVSNSCWIMQPWYVWIMSPTVDVRSNHGMPVLCPRLPMCIACLYCVPDCRCVLHACIVSLTADVYCMPVLCPLLPMCIACLYCVPYCRCVLHACIVSLTADVYCMPVLCPRLPMCIACLYCVPYCRCVLHACIVSLTADVDLTMVCLRCVPSCRCEIWGRYHGGRRPSSDDSFHSPTVIPPSALDKPSIMKRYHRRQTTRWGVAARWPTMVALHNTRFVEFRWWNDGWTVKTVVTWRSSAFMIRALWAWYVCYIHCVSLRASCLAACIVSRCVFCVSSRWCVI